MVEHWSEKPGVDSSILSLGILFLPNLAYFVVVQKLEYLGATAPVPTVYFAFSLLELHQISLKNPTPLLTPSAFFFCLVCMDYTPSTKNTVFKTASN